MIPTYWHYCDNFGDALAPWLVQKITGLPARYVDPRTPNTTVPYMLTGSILGWSIRRANVWGSGSAFESDLDPTKFAPPSDEFRIFATRGPLSRRVVESVGHRPHASGDPGLLLPRFYSPSVRERARVGIFCSWIDYDRVSRLYGATMPVVRSLGAVEPIVDQICSWDFVVSDCLHGLVTAVAYGKPVLWVKFSESIVGTGFKFRDFFASLGVQEPSCYEPSPEDTPEDLVARARTYELPDLDPLYECCPLPRSK